MVDNIFDFFYGFRHNRMRLECDARERAARLRLVKIYSMHSFRRLRPMMEFAIHVSVFGIKFQFHFARNMDDCQLVCVVVVVLDVFGK